MEVNIEGGKASPTANLAENTEPKLTLKYVEAPIPKVNPWKKNEISTTNVEKPAEIKNPITVSSATLGVNVKDNKSGASSSNKDEKIFILFLKNI